MLAIVSGCADTDKNTVSVGHVFRYVYLFLETINFGNRMLMKISMPFAFMPRKDTQFVKIQLFKYPSFSRLN